MNKAEKIAHLRALAAAIENGEELLFNGKGIHTETGNEPTSTCALFAFSITPKPWRAWAAFSKTNGKFLQFYESENYARSVQCVGGAIVEEVMKVSDCEN